MVKKDQEKAKSDAEGDVVDDVLSEEEVKLDDDKEQSETKDGDEKEASGTTELKAEEVVETKQEAKEVPVSQKEVPGKTTEESKADAKAVEKEEEDSAPPPRPARPLTPRQEARKNLKDAFPTIEEKYIQAVLIASSYNLEPAFNALLYISDPESINPDEIIPVQVPVVESARPKLPARKSHELTQLEQDELLAKKLDEDYRRRERRRAARRQEQRTGGAQSSTYDDDDEDDVFTTFVEKDLPQIKEQFTKNIEETKTKFNSWVSGWKKQYQASASNLNERSGNSRNNHKNSFEFDEEPEELDLQQFHGISLNDTSKDPSSGIDENKPKLPNRNRAGSTDLYGTPKNSNKKWERLDKAKPEPISKLESTADPTGGAVEDDDFLLSDDEDVNKK